MANVVITSIFNEITIKYNDTVDLFGQDEVVIYGDSLSCIGLVIKNGAVELWVEDGQVYNFSYDNVQVPIVDSVNGVAPSSLQDLKDKLIDLRSGINKSPTATVTTEVEITVNTAVTASASDEDRVYWAVSIRTKDAYIRFIPASTDASERKGIYLKKDQTYEMPTDRIYTGEISIINKKNGEKPEYTITTF